MRRLFDVTLNVDIFGHAVLLLILFGDILSKTFSGSLVSFFHFKSVSFKTKELLLLGFFYLHTACSQSPSTPSNCQLVNSVM